MIVKDTMVLIHLAKMTVLEICCEYFKNVIISKLVYEEILAGKEKGYSDSSIIENLVKKMKIKIKEVTDLNLLKAAMEYNLKEGEMESVALYWQEKADYLASDDDNVRKKSTILNINLIGTPSIILNLYKEKLIEKDKYFKSVAELKKIGWFSNAVIDKLLSEVKKDERTNRNKIA